MTRHRDHDDWPSGPWLPPSNKGALALAFGLWVLFGIVFGGAILLLR